mgnify:CR=1 FL=1
MSPGGHLVTTAVACAAVYTGTESLALIAGRMRFEVLEESR